MSTTKTHEFTATRNALGGIVKVTACLSKMDGNERPYFSVTGEVWYSSARHKRGAESDTCGCVHEAILEAFPELSPVVALHLSDDRGVPMHAEANGLYHLGFGKWSSLDLEVAADHFRITVEEAEELRERIELDAITIGGSVEGMRERWGEEARAAIALLDSLAEGEGTSC